MDEPQYNCKEYLSQLKTSKIDEALLLLKKKRYYSLAIHCNKTVITLADVDEFELIKILQQPELNHNKIKKLLKYIRRGYEL